MGWDLDPWVGLGGWAWLLQDESLHVVCRGDSMVSIAWAWPHSCSVGSHKEPDWLTPSRLPCLCPHPEINRQALDMGCQLGYSNTWSFSWQEPPNALYFPLCP